LRVANSACPRVGDVARSAILVPSRTRRGRNSACRDGMPRAVPGAVAGVRNHTELHVWRICDELRRRVAAVAGRPGLLRDPWLRNQLVAAAESPCPSIAEGFSRYHPRENGRTSNPLRRLICRGRDHQGRTVSRRTLAEGARGSEVPGFRGSLVSFLDAAIPTRQTLNAERRNPEPERRQKANLRAPRFPRHSRHDP
jgi:hypothetical protein